MSNLNPALSLEAREMDAVPSHPWRETKSRFPEDDYLRRFGYVIHSRRRDEEAFWRHPPDDGIVPHSIAVAVTARRVANAGRTPRNPRR